MDTACCQIKCIILWAANCSQGNTVIKSQQIMNVFFGITWYLLLRSEGQEIATQKHTPFFLRALFTESFPYAREPIKLAHHITPCFIFQTSSYSKDDSKQLIFTDTYSITFSTGSSTGSCKMAGTFKKKNGHTEMYKVSRRLMSQSCAMKLPLVNLAWVSTHTAVTYSASPNMVMTSNEFIKRTSSLQIQTALWFHFTSFQLSCAAMISLHISTNLFLRILRAL